jgi:pilus assembly protein Flp/PilA
VSRTATIRHISRLRSQLLRLLRAAPVLGQSMVEYAIIAALVAVIALAAVRTLGTNVSGAFNAIGSQVGTVEQDAQSGGGGGGH